MPIQRTFTLVPQVPTPAGGAATPARPMTSKQVRKAYKEANRTPTLSKAERKRQEKAEQERIQKELDKERTAARAKAARDRKREKELAEREEKKRKRLPLVNVRPSQDTIARFVRGNGSGKKRDAGGEDVQAVQKSPGPLVMEPTIEEEPEETMDAMIDADTSLVEEPSPEKVANTGQEHSKSQIATEEEIPENHPPDADPSMDTPPNANHEENLRCDAQVAAPESKNPKSKESEKPSSFSSLDLISGEVDDNHLGHEVAGLVPQQESAPQKLNFQEIYLLSDEDLELEMLALDAITTKPPLEHSDPRSSPPMNEQNEQKQSRKETIYENDLGIATTGPKETSVTATSAPPGRNSLMPPPPPPPPQLCRPTPLAPQPQEPPLSTQAILFNFDDFFPTSSQQAKELDEEYIHFTPSQPTKPSPLRMPQMEIKVQDSGPILSPPSQPSSSPDEPKRFFTSSGTNERIAVAMLHSKRTAEREEWQRKQAMRIEALQLKRVQKEEERKARHEKLAVKIKSTRNQHPQSIQKQTPATQERNSHQRNNLPPRAVAPPLPIKESAPSKISTPKSFDARPSPKTQATEAKRPRPVGPQTVVAAKVPAFDATNPLHTTKKIPPATAPARKAVVAPRPSGQVNQLPPPRPSNNNKPPFQVEGKKAMAVKPPSQENIPPVRSYRSEKSLPIASQESEYGGDWVDEIATELML